MGSLVSILVVGLSLLAATPARAAVGNAVTHSGILQRFGIMLVSPNATPGANTERHAQVSATSTGPATPGLTLEEAQQRVSFLIRTPSWLPPHVVFRGALVPSGDTSVVVAYQRLGDRSRGMFIQIRPGGVAGGYAVPSSASQQVQVSGQAAVYARGSWDRVGTWHGDADAGLLSWQQDGMDYVLSWSGLGLSREDAIRIAESMR
jgi:hypothetical protein